METGKMNEKAIEIISVSEGLNSVETQFPPSRKILHHWKFQKDLIVWKPRAYC